jgi:hypothetical protein
LGQATAAAEEALGLARAKGFDAQRRAIGSEQTALVAALREVSAGGVKIVPDIQVGGDGGGVIGGLGALLMRSLASDGPSANGGAATARSGHGDNGTNGTYVDVPASEGTDGTGGTDGTDGTDGSDATEAAD